MKTSYLNLPHKINLIMKKTLNIILASFVLLLISCGGKEEKKKEGFSYEKKAPTEQKATKVESVAASKKIDLTNKGVNRISKV